MNRLPFIDALRGLAVFGVLIVHCGQKIDGLPRWLNSLVGEGARGVQLFFIISAFTLFLSLDNRKKAEKNPNLNFFIRRFFRIAPLFYCAIVFYLIQDYLLTNKSFYYINLLSLATFTNGWHPDWVNNIVPGSWTIAIEMTFYLMVPYLFKKVISLDRAVFLTLIALILNDFLIVLIRKFPILYKPTAWESLFAYWLPNQFPIFCLGFVVYFLILRMVIKPGIAEEKSARQKFNRGFVMLAIAVFLLLALPYGGNYSYIPRHFLYGMAFVLLTLALALHPFGFFVNSFWLYLGQISYSAYLTHFAVLKLVNNFLNQVLLGFQLNLSPVLHLVILTGMLLAVTVAIASLTYRFIELPGQAIGRRLIAKLEAKSVTVSS